MTSEAKAFAQTEEYVYTPLIEQLHDANPAVREAACWALGELRYKAANRHLSKVLGGDPDEMVRLGAAMALGKIGGSYSTLALIRCLKDASTLVRGFCVQTLGSLKDKQAVYPLEQMLRGETDEGIREHVHRALELLAGKREAQRGPVQRKIQKFMRQIETDPDNPIPYNNLAVTYFNQERYAMAREYLEKAKERGANVRNLERRFAELPADKFSADPDHEIPEDVVLPAEAFASTASDEAEDRDGGRRERRDHPRARGGEGSATRGPSEGTNGDAEEMESAPGAAVEPRDDRDAGRGEEIGAEGTGERVPEASGDGPGEGRAPRDSEAREQRSSGDGPGEGRAPRDSEAREQRSSGDGPGEGRAPRDPETREQRSSGDGEGKGPERGDPSEGRDRDRGRGRDRRGRRNRDRRRGGKGRRDSD